MTTASDALQPAGQPADSGKDGLLPSDTEPAAAGTVWPRLEQLLDALSERMNPILVKEARQAMKSKQFSVTFTLLLIFGWVYTVLFVILNLPGVFYSPFGTVMLVGYYLILAVPLLIVVPYASFRSLAAELEDGTYDLLSITALSARQIVTGKLGSSLLQMMVYYSALAPCIAFTYLLRGIDVVTIGLLLAYTFLASLLLSILALTLSTVTRARHWQVLLSVLLVIALLVFGFFWCWLMFGMLASATTMPYDQPAWWMFNLAVIMFYIPIALLFILIAAGQVTFASENRSTGVRIVLMVLQTLIVGWTLYGFVYVSDEDVVMMGSTWLGILWAVAGGFLIGEMAQLSPRARRELPQSVLGRMAFTWFNPGSGTGYVFTVLNLLGGMLTMAMFVTMGTLVTGNWGGTSMDVWTAWWMAIVSYITIYTGLARLFGGALHRLGSGSMVGTFVTYLLLLVMGVAGPLAIQALLRWMLNQGVVGEFEYTPLQMSNWIWTLYEIGRDRAAVSDGTPWFLAFGALAVFLLNFVFAAGEVEKTRLAAPQRVLDDEALLHPAPKPAKRSPWDEPA
jgi:ABC-type transport system involved in multi-copper enzyme maturation permease subunit